MFVVNFLSVFLRVYRIPASVMFYLGYSLFKVYMNSSLPFFYSAFPSVEIGL